MCSLMWARFVVDTRPSNNILLTSSQTLADLERHPAVECLYKHAQGNLAILVVW